MERVVEGKGVEGLGQTTSRTFSGQYSLMWLCRYNCRSSGRPEGTITGGNSSAVFAGHLRKVKNIKHYHHFTIDASSLGSWAW